MGTACHAEMHEGGMKREFFGGRDELLLVPKLGLRGNAALPVYFLFRLQSQLTARGINIVAFFAAQGGDNLSLFQRGEKFFLGFLVRAFPRQTLDPVVGNQVHLREKSARERSE